MLKVDVKQDELAAEFFQIYKHVASVYKEQFQKYHDELNENIPLEYSEFKHIFIESNNYLLGLFFEYIKTHPFNQQHTFNYKPPINDKSEYELTQMYIILPKLINAYSKYNENIHKHVIELMQDLSERIKYKYANINDSFCSTVISCTGSHHNQYGDPLRNYYELPKQ